MRPIDLEVLMHYSVSAEQHPKLSVAVYADAALWLMSEGALEPLASGYQVTKLGRVWLQLACHTMKPRLGFVDTNGREVTP